jgi:signal transduction histidine kinase
LLNRATENTTEFEEFPILARASLTDYFILDSGGNVKTSGTAGDTAGDHPLEILKSIPLFGLHLRPDTGGAFYDISGLVENSPTDNPSQALYLGHLPDSAELIGLNFSMSQSLIDVVDMKSEIMILSLISQAVRAFNRAENLETILKIVLIGVTAGCGLGFNRAFVLLTCDEHNCLRGALANGPSSPEEASMIWNKLSKGEITLKKMFDAALENDALDNPPLNGFLKDIEIPLDDKDNIFVNAALEQKSIIISEAEMSSRACSNLQATIGPGPMAVVPLNASGYLQGVLIADNFITRKEITENYLHLLEIFDRYASDSIKNFRLYERLERKVQALKKANEMIINSRENMIKAERLSVLAEMAGDVAHEIRNPLTIIGGFAKSMLKKAPANEPNLEYLEIIYQQVERIARSLENFTSLINYESASDRICNLGDIVKSAVAVRIPGADFSHFEVNIEDKIPVKCDPDLIRQAFIIVLKRASSINRDNIPIHISTCRRNDKALVLIKSSNAANEFASKLYQSFSAGGGHELLKQLSTTLEILKYYRGNIGIESEGPDNERFYLELPVFEEDK